MGKNFNETATNLGVTIVFWTTIWKVKICTSPLIVNLVKSIEKSEQAVIKTSDESLSAIYRKHVRQSTRESFAQLIVGGAGIMLYFIRPLIENYQFSKMGKNDKSFIFLSWFPFDEYKHYWCAYLVSLVSGIYGAGYTLSTAMFLFCTMIFSSCEIKMLQHKFRNFTSYVDKYAKDNNMTNAEAERIVLRNYILEHWKIIELVKTLKNAYKTYMLLDFTVCSFQFSMLIIQVIQRGKLDLTSIAVSMYVGTMAVQVLLIYSNAHELIIQSGNIAQAIYDSEWYNVSNNTKKDLMFVMMRAQKPLYLSIGPLYEIRRELLLKIVQALYSYLCVILK